MMKSTTDDDDDDGGGGAEDEDDERSGGGGKGGGEKRRRRDRDDDALERGKRDRCFRGEDCKSQRSVFERNSKIIIIQESSKEEDLEEEEEDAFQAIIKRVNKYQEKCEMLDRHLEKWIVPLTEEVLRFHAVLLSNHVFDDVDETKKHIESHLCVSHAPNVKSFTRVCYGARCENNRSIFPAQRERFGTGYQDAAKVHAEAGRSAIKYEVAGFWDRYQPGTRETLTEEVASESLFETSWETRATLLSWISVLVLMPFDMKTFVKTTTIFDNSAEGGVGGGSSSSNSSSGDENKAGLIEDLLGMCRQCVSFSEVARDRAAICVARLLTRPDAELNLGEYLDWSSSELMRVFGRKKAGEEESTKDKIAEAVAASEDSFVAVGATRSMAAIFKIGRRDVLKPFRESALKASQAVFDAKTPSPFFFFFWFAHDNLERIDSTIGVQTERARGADSFSAESCLLEVCARK